MPASMHGTIKTLLALSLVLATLPMTGCTGGTSSNLAFYNVGSAEQKKELSALFALLELHGPQGSSPDSMRHFAAARKVASILVTEKEYAKAAAFLVQCADLRDEYASWYLFTAAASYEAAGDIQLAIPLYERTVKDAPDAIVEGQSLHHASLSRLVKSATLPERKINYYRELLARFPEASDTGTSYFLLGKEYEKVGDWKNALDSYSKFLPWFGAVVPGYPDALKYARELTEFAASPKDWIQENLDDLVRGIRKALASGSASGLRKYASKAGFFAVSWYQDTDDDANSKVRFDLSQFMRSQPIRSDEKLDSSSGPREAYLKTWGWAGRVPVWYLCFRKINFPADPSVHGRWEWAGIYFGEKMQ
ncbi:MAG: tetratricopeptide repeat protein [Spirochaetaceae bacterium]|nr:tetratricopeptide repeat protein [Spirochaetaceae bacterium]